jgi:hypothetical protein
LLPVFLERVFVSNKELGPAARAGCPSDASTDTAPVPNTIPNQTASQSQANPLNVTLNATDAENGPVKFTAQAVG